VIIGIIGSGTAGTIAGLHIVKALGKPSARTRVFLCEGVTHLEAGLFQCV